MSDEITVSAYIRGARSDWDRAFGKIGLQFDMTGTEYQDGVQTIGTSEEALELGDVGTPGYVVLCNLDPTNYVEVRPNTGVADLVKLDPNFGIAIFKLAADAVPYLIANTAACRVQYLLLEA